MNTPQSPPAPVVPSLEVRSGGLGRELQPGPDYVIGRDPHCDITIEDPRVSPRHAMLQVQDGRWVLTDVGSANGTYLGQRRVSRVEIDGECLLRLGHPSAGLALACSVSGARPAAPTRQRSVAHPVPARTVRIGRAPDNDIVIAQTAVSRYHAELRSVAGGHQIADLGSTHGTFVNGQRVSAAALADGDFVGIGPVTFRLAGQDLQEYSDAVAAEAPAAGAAGDDGALEIPYAVRWLVPRGERFANFDILNDNDTQLDYYREFGHIYAVGIPTKKWRLVVVSDPELLDEVAANEEQFGKTVEEINFFTQLANSRGTGISVIGDGEHYERIRRVMLPWYAPSHQRTQVSRMQEQARKLVAAWAAIPDDQPLDARNWMERYSLEVSGRGACSYDFGLLDGAGDPHPFATAVPESTKESIRRVADPWPDATLLASPARRARTRRYRQQNKELFATAGALVRGRQHTCPLGQQTDLLSRLVSVPDPESGELLDADTVRDQILMHLSNGFNGPSITGAWLAYVLATHPEMQDRVIAEIDGVTGGDPDYDLQYDDLLSLTYTTQVIKETLRIYPPQPVSIRRSRKDGRLGKYRIRKDDIILVGTLAAQRDPRYWGPEPDTFNPDHFAPDKIAARPRHAFIPFSVGKRQCMAQEVTFMMLRIALCAICTHYQLRLAPGATVAKNTIVTTKPAAVPIIRLPREVTPRPRKAAADRSLDIRPAVAAPDWGPPTEIPAASQFGHLVIAYGSNFGATKELAERFAERSHFHGYTADLITLNELAASPPRDQPWLLVVLTSTYTSNPPSNAAAFKSWLEQAQPGSPAWRNCRYLVWGLGNTQWNAYLAFPRYVHGKLAGLGATPLADLGFADVGMPTWQRQHADWNGRIWPVLLELSGAMPTKAAADRDAAERASASALTGPDSTTAMHRSLTGAHASPRLSSVQRKALLVPSILTNAAGLRTVQARVLGGGELQSAQSPRRTRHLELSLPPGVSYWAGDHLGVCPQNNEDAARRLAYRLGAALDGLFTVPETVAARAVPKGTVLQVRNVLTSLVDLAGPPPAELTDLVLSKAGPGRASAAASSRDVLALLDAFPDCQLNLFEFLRVAQPLRPRYYSISSSPRIHGDGIAHLTVGLTGMASRYLHDLRTGDRLNVFPDSAGGFHLQDDPAKPMIFVSAGTGLAPMRAFLWERQAMLRNGTQLGEAALFNGIRSAGLDYIYRAEVEQFAADGVLDHVHVAASREVPGKRDYVQDQIIAQGALVWRLLSAGGFVYVCGSQPMRDGVRAAFAAVAAAHGPMPAGQAAVYLAELEATSRYRPDLWG